MEKEGGLIWQRNATMNKAGTKHQYTPLDEEQTFFSRRRRFRWVKRLTEIGHRLGWNTWWSEKKEDEDTFQQGRFMRRVRWVLRAARRPWREDLLKSIHGIAERFCRLDLRELKRVIQVAFDILDATDRSIFMTNLKIIARFNWSFIVVFKDLRSPLFMLDEVKREVRKQLQAWNTNIPTDAILFMFRTRFVATASQSIYDIVQNATFWNKKTAADFV